jgi:hypothetical protein
MARYSVETKRTPEQVIEMAEAYFGEGGLGLDAGERGPCCVYFEGGGGYVSVTASEGENTATVDLETREWDYHVRQFMRAVA